MKKILIVDDSESDRMIMEKYFKNDYRVLELDNGPDTLLYITKHKPDLVLLDILMPGIQGDEICYNLKNSSDTKHIPVVFVSGMEFEQYENTYGSLIADGYLEKPLNPDLTISTVKKLLADPDPE